MDPLHPPIPTSIANPAQDIAGQSGQRHFYASYSLPGDDQERGRLDLQHELYLGTFGGKLFLSPLQNPRSILDIGTGTGAWALDMARQFPNAQVEGLDINPKPPQHVLENFKYIVGSFEEPWPSEKASSDFVHARMIVVALKDYRRFIHQAFEALKPGAWFELQDLSVPLANASGLMAEWNEYYVQGNKKLGLDMSAAEHAWEDWLQQAGFENIKHQRFEWHFAPIPDDPEASKLAELSKRNLVNGLEGFSTRVFTQGLGWSKAELDTYLAKVRGAIEEIASETYLPIHAIYAQKPRSA